LLWITLPLLFFTLSQSKRPQYVLPMVPAVALLIASTWQEPSERLPGTRLGAVGLAALGSFFIAASRMIPNLVPASPETAAAIPFTAVFLGTVCLGAGVLAWIAQRRKELLLLAFSLPVVAIPFSSHSLMREIGNERSAALIAEAITEAAGTPVRVIGVEAYPPSLPFYLQHTMIVATDDGSELTSNYLTRHVREYRGFGAPLRRFDWWQDALLTCSEPTVFIVSREDARTREALGALSLVIETDKYVAYGPCGMETLALARQ
jgi:4-amino-4-deoxy-L-arabinose transferase-like glycosyltransferase